MDLADAQVMDSKALKNNGDTAKTAVRNSVTMNPAKAIELMGRTLSVFPTADSNV
jgi:hypothetical protein